MRQEVWVWSGGPGHDWLGCAGLGWWTAWPYEYHNGFRSLVWLLLGRVTSRRHLDLEAARASRIVLQMGKTKSQVFQLPRRIDSAGRYECDCAIVRLCPLCPLCYCAIESNFPTLARAARHFPSRRLNIHSARRRRWKERPCALCALRAVRTQARMGTGAGNWDSRSRMRCIIFHFHFPLAWSLWRNPTPGLASSAHSQTGPRPQHARRCGEAQMGLAHSATWPIETLRLHNPTHHLRHLGPRSRSGPEWVILSGALGNSHAHKTVFQHTNTRPKSWRVQPAPWAAGGVPGATHPPPLS